MIIVGEQEAAEYVLFVLFLAVAIGGTIFLLVDALRQAHQLGENLAEGWLLRRAAKRHWREVDRARALATGHPLRWRLMWQRHVRELF